jgi:Ni,Fe-hydrogenase maturation factor
LASLASLVVLVSIAVTKPVRVIGCEAAELDDYRLGLSPPVELATGPAAEMAIGLMKKIRAAG